MSGRRRFICPNGFHRAMRLCFRREADDVRRIAHRSNVRRSGPGCVSAGGRWSMPTYEYMCKKCGPFTQLRPMAECELPSACPECGTRAPRVLLTAPRCLSMSAEARQAGAKYERSTDGLHEVPPYLRDPTGMTKKLKTAQKVKRAQARASRPA